VLTPGLHTDVVLRGKDWTRIVECKYMPRLLATGRHHTRQFHSAHLRQLFAYLSREAAKYPTRNLPDGLLSTRLQRIPSTSAQGSARSTRESPRSTSRFRGRTYANA
jgi:hypothetical protein